MLDATCGTGIVARLAAERVGPDGSVAGVDITPGMLSVARTVTAHLPIRWYETSVESMPLSDHAFDVVFCQLGLQFVADKAAALREMRRVLVPGGRLYLSVPAPSRFFDVLEAAHRKGREVGVTWFYDMRNERVGELAEEFKEDCTFPFSVVGR